MAMQTRDHHAVNRNFLGYWTVACATGELLGFAVVTAVTALVLAIVGQPTGGLNATLYTLSLLAAGACQGGIVGIFQWRVLRLRVPEIGRQRWAAASSIAMSLCWLLALVPGATTAEGILSSGGTGWPMGLNVLVAAISGLVLGAVFGAGQWLVLSRHVERADRWITANALGWSLALLWLVFGAALPSSSTSLLATAFIGAFSALAAGLTWGGVTGLYLLAIPPNGTQRGQ